MPRRITPFWACVTIHAEKHRISKQRAKLAVDRFWPELCNRERDQYRAIAAEMNEGRRMCRQPVEIAAQQPLDEVAEPQREVIVIDDDDQQPHDTPAQNLEEETVEQQQPVAAVAELSPESEIRLDEVIRDLDLDRKLMDYEEISDTESDDTDYSYSESVIDDSAYASA